MLNLECSYGYAHMTTLMRLVAIQMTDEMSNFMVQKLNTHISYASAQSYTISFRNKYIYQKKNDSETAMFNIMSVIKGIK